jgi:hypothetical protein
MIGVMVARKDCLRFDGKIVYDTPVTNDVIGWLDFAGVATILKDIEELPPRN